MPFVSVRLTWRAHSIRSISRTPVSLSWSRFSRRPKTTLACTGARLRSKAGPILLAFAAVVSSSSLASATQGKVDELAEEHQAQEPATRTGVASAPQAAATDQAAWVDLGGETRGRTIPNISAELGIGLLTLPTAEVCVQRALAGCRKGDSSLELNAWPFFRATRSFAVGAGLTLALFPDASAPRSDPPDIPREHIRQYFLIEGTARYYAVSGSSVEIWLAPTVGLVVISDTFVSKRDVADVVQVGASQGFNLATEGLSLGGGAGISLVLSDHWQVGSYLRATNWFLPDEPARTPTRDEASLAGNVLMLDVGLSIGFTTPR
jgi:hypothetical protein